MNQVSSYASKVKRDHVLLAPTIVVTISADRQEINNL